MYPRFIPVGRTYKTDAGESIRLQFRQTVNRIGSRLETWYTMRTPGNRKDFMSRTYKRNTAVLLLLILSISMTRDILASLVHPELIESHVTDIAMLEEISKFRSGAGHDFSYDPSFNYAGEYFGATDATEPDSSMKHYLAPYAAYLGDMATVPVYAPFDGVITRVTEETNSENPSIVNKRIELTSVDNPDYLAVLFHIDLDNDYPQIKNDWPAAVWPAHQADDATYVTDTLSAGDLMGYADMRTGHDFDIAVLYSVTATEKYWVSYFDLMPDTLFSAYEERGASRSELSISKAHRLSNPIISWGGRNDDDWVELQVVPETGTLKIAIFGLLCLLNRTASRNDKHRRN